MTVLGRTAGVLVLLVGLVFLTKSEFTVGLCFVLAGALVVAAFGWPRRR